MSKIEKIVLDEPENNEDIQKLMGKKIGNVEMKNVSKDCIK